MRRSKLAFHAYIHTCMTCTYACLRGHVQRRAPGRVPAVNLHTQVHNLAHLVGVRARVRVRVRVRVRIRARARTRVRAVAKLRVRVQAVPRTRCSTRFE